MPRILVVRILISLLLGLVAGALMSEFAFFFLKETSRPPKQILLTIPAGTAEEVARGEQPPSIPANMIFVVGDELVVKNEDSVTHKLGPLWIPAGTSASLQLGNAENLLFECSFQPTSYFGVDVREPLTLTTRMVGIFLAGFPLGVLFALYSVIMYFQKKEPA